MPLSASAQKVQDALTGLGLDIEVQELDHATRTSAEAAAAVGCTVAQIAKSLVFRGIQSGKPVLVVASGINRVDEKKLEGLVGEKIDRPDATFVRLRTGYVIGGVPPLAHAEPMETYVDEDLNQYAEIWAAAGTPNAVFRLTPEELVRITGAKVVAIKR